MYWHIVFFFGKFWKKLGWVCAHGFDLCFFGGVCSQAGVQGAQLLGGDAHARDRAWGRQAGELCDGGWGGGGQAVECGEKKKKKKKEDGCPPTGF
jgi:hypothetical protein